MHDNQRQAVLYAYIAGIFDGEGCFRINKVKKKEMLEKFNLLNPVYQPIISIGMVNKEIMDLLKNIYGFGTPREELIPNRRGIWRWQSTGRLKTLAVIKSVYPYLIIKKPQADLLIKFCEGFENRRVKIGTNWRCTSKKEILRREDLYQKMKKLNLVGAAATTNRDDIREDEVIV